MNQRAFQNRAYLFSFLILFALVGLCLYLVNVLDLTLLGMLVFFIIFIFVVPRLAPAIGHDLTRLSFKLQDNNKRRQARSRRGQTKTQSTWTHVIIPEAAKGELMTLQRILADPKGYQQRWGMKPPMGAILHGPPGTGKTLIARTLAANAGYAFIAPSPAEISSRWVGESEKAIAELYSAARRAAPCIVFLDELDTLAATRSGTAGDAGGAVRGYNNATNQLLQEIDGFGGREDIFTMGATNRLDILDPAITSRLGMHIHIDLPDLEARIKLFTLYTHPYRERLTVDITTLAKRGGRLSGRDIEQGCTRAALLAESRGLQTVGIREFEAAFNVPTTPRA